MRQISLFSTKPLADLPIGHIEEEARAAGYRWVLGVDEAGRGPLAGPVTAGAVLLDLQALEWCTGITDSKKLTARARETFATVIEQRAPHAFVAHVSAQEVDRQNILAASLSGMRTCALSIIEEAQLSAEEFLVVVDGKQALPEFSFPQQAVIKGDARSLAVAAASVLAKVKRDAWMMALHAEYPVYGFDRHKGYPTKMHLAALQEYGACAHHRKSFAPVAATFDALDR